MCDHAPGSALHHVLPPAGVRSGNEGRDSEVFRYNRVTPYYPNDPCIRPNEADLTCPPEPPQSQHHLGPRFGVKTQHGDMFAFGQVRANRPPATPLPATGPCPARPPVTDPSQCPCTNRGAQDGQQYRNQQLIQQLGSSGHDIKTSQGRYTSLNANGFPSGNCPYVNTIAQKCPEGLRRECLNTKYHRQATGDPSGYEGPVCPDGPMNHPLGQTRCTGDLNCRMGLLTNYRRPPVYGPDFPYFSPGTPGNFPMGAGNKGDKIVKSLRMPNPLCPSQYYPAPYVCRPVYNRKYLMDCPEQDGPPADTYTFL